MYGDNPKVLSDTERKLAGYDFYECRAWGHKWEAHRTRGDGLRLQTGRPNTAALKHVCRVSVCLECNAQRVEQFEIVLWRSGEVRFVRRKPAVYTYPEGYKLEDTSAAEVRLASRATLIYEFGRGDGW